MFGIFASALIFAASIIPQTPSRGVVVGGAAPTYLLESALESSTGWTSDVSAGGTITFGDTDQFIEGAGAVEFAPTGSHIFTTSPTFTAQNEAWAFFAVYFTGTTSTANTELFNFRSSSANLGGLRLSSTAARLVAFHGTATANIASGYTTGWNYFWVRYVIGTGADGILDVYSATTDTKPGSPIGSVTTGTSTAQTDRIRFQGRLTGDTQPTWIDKARVDDAVIGSSPQ